MTGVSVETSKEEITEHPLIVRARRADDERHEAIHQFEREQLAKSRDEWRAVAKTIALQLKDALIIRDELLEEVTDNEMNALEEIDFEDGEDDGEDDEDQPA